MADREENALDQLDNVMDEADDLGSLGEGDQGGGITDIIGQQLEGISDVPYEPYDAGVSAEELMETGQVEPTPMMPCNEATMVCLRGPCVHWWGMLTRVEAQAPITSIQRTQACARHVRLVALQDENTFRCSDWWPRSLQFVPTALRPYLQRLLTERWERKLEEAGEDFSWRWWPERVFELSSREVKRLRDAAIAKAEAESDEADDKASPLSEALDL